MSGLFRRDPTIFQWFVGRMGHFGVVLDGEDTTFSKDAAGHFVEAVMAKPRDFSYTVKIQTSCSVGWPSRRLPPVTCRDVLPYSPASIG